MKLNMLRWNTLSNTEKADRLGKAASFIFPVGCALLAVGIIGLCLTGQWVVAVPFGIGGGVIAGAMWYLNKD